MNEESASLGSDGQWRVLAALLTGAAVFNAFAYMVRFANPFMTCDYWYFVDAFVRKAASGSLGALDFFVKRIGPDHAQPLKKLILLLNVHIADLDLAFDALIGFGFAVACVALLERLLRKDLPGHHRDWFYALSAAALAASLLTLNAGIVFGYSLVLLEFSVYLVVIVAFITAWRAMASGSWMPYIASIIVLNLIADDSALLATGALVVASAFLAVQQRRMTPLLAGVLAIAIHLSYVLGLEPHLPRHGSMPALAAGSTSISMLLSQQQWLALFTVPLASTLMHLSPLQYWTPAHVIAATWALSMLAALMHALFWYRAFRGQLNQTSFVAIGLMLLMYAYVAGIVYARVPVYGAGYLNSPRYCLFYLLSNVALVLMATVEYRRPLHRFGRMIAVPVVGLLLMVQLPLAIYSWALGPAVLKYQHTMGQQVLKLETLPEDASPAALPLLQACNAPPSMETVRYMQQHHLNVFSEKFRRRHAALLEAPQLP